MTWEELEELRDRLSNILERERAEDGFSPSRRIIISYGRQPGEPSQTTRPSRDRDRYQTLQEICDAGGDL